MPVSIQLPDALAHHAGGQRTVAVDAASVGEALDRLEASFPALRARLRDARGNVRRFLNVLADARDIRFLDNLATPLGDDAQLSIVQAVATGWYHGGRDVA
ncbi:MAG: molybdopterin synthase sulfur carrier subunit [Deltaproteobacteria bacterium]|nr:MAG: molybdopterin synthase sulfur carrier subunit [Deltaproteobacteria bacterium]